MERLVEDAVHSLATPSKVKNIINTAKAFEYHEENLHRQSAQRIHLSQPGTGPRFKILQEHFETALSPVPLNCEARDEAQNTALRAVRLTCISGFALANCMGSGMESFFLGWKAVRVRTGRRAVQGTNRPT